MPSGNFSFILIAAACMAACSGPGRITKTETQEYVISDSASADVDSTLEHVIMPYRDSMTSVMNTTLAVSDHAMVKGQPESLLGNFFSDACLEVARDRYRKGNGSSIDFAFFNNGGLRSSLPKGPVTRGNVFELMPFDNELVVVTVNGALAEKIFNFIASKDGVPVSGVRFEISEGRPHQIVINGIPLDTSKVYKALTSDYLANGGDQYFFLAEAPRETLNLKIRDALIHYMQDITSKGKTISARLDQRITHVK